MLHSRRANLPKSSMLAGNRSKEPDRSSSVDHSGTRSSRFSPQSPNVRPQVSLSGRSEVFKFPCCSTSLEHTREHTHTLPAAPLESPPVHTHPAPCLPTSPCTQGPAASSGRGRYCSTAAGMCGQSVSPEKHKGAEMFTLCMYVT